MKSNVLTA